MTFFNLAFTEADQEKMQTLDVIDDLSSTGGISSHPYIEEEDTYTVDKIFIPWRSFVVNTNYFASDSDKIIFQISGGGLL